MFKVNNTKILNIFQNFFSVFVVDFEQVNVRWV